MKRKMEMMVNNKLISDKRRKSKIKVVLPKEIWHHILTFSDNNSLLQIRRIKMLKEISDNLIKYIHFKRDIGFNEGMTDIEEYEKNMSFIENFKNLEEIKFEYCSCFFFLDMVKKENKKLKIIRFVRLNITHLNYVDYFCEFEFFGEDFNNYIDLKEDILEKLNTENIKEEEIKKYETYFNIINYKKEKYLCDMFEIIDKRYFNETIEILYILKEDIIKYNLKHEIDEYLSFFLSNNSFNTVIFILHLMSFLKIEPNWKIHKNSMSRILVCDEINILNEILRFNFNIDFLITNEYINTFYYMLKNKSNTNRKTIIRKYMFDNEVIKRKCFIEFCVNVLMNDDIETGLLYEICEIENIVYGEHFVSLIECISSKNEKVMEKFLDMITFFSSTRQIVSEKIRDVFINILNDELINGNLRKITVFSQIFCELIRIHSKYYKFLDFFHKILSVSEKIGPKRSLYYLAILNYIKFDLKSVMTFKMSENLFTQNTINQNSKI